MTDVLLERLNLACPAAREEYERAFYSAFARVATNRLVRRLWVWDDAQRRIATRVAYEDQIIYVFRDAAGSIAVAMAVNTTLRVFQSAAYGFPCPADRRGCCELLTFFTVRGHDLRTGFRFWSTTFDDLVRSGFHTALATTATRVLRFYLRMGAHQLDETVVDNERRHFLQFDLLRTTWQFGPD
jgi:hypothetical protein